MLQIPNEPFLRELFCRWQSEPGLVIVRDAHTGQNATVHVLLQDVVQVRTQLLTALSDDTRSQLENGSEDVFIPVLATAGYELVVSFLAIFSLGAATVPLSPAILPEEAKYFFTLCKATILITTAEHAEKAREISKLTSVSSITPDIATTSDSVEELELSSAPSTSLERAGSLLYTSGTTGKSKGVLHTRRAIYDQARVVASFFRLTTEDLWLNPNPAHWIGGFGMFQASLYSATPVELSAGVRDRKWFWQRIKDANITVIVTPPGICNGWEAAYHDLLPGWTQAELEAIKTGLQRLRVLACGSMASTSSTKAFWRNLLHRTRLLNNYGATETFLHVATEPLDSVEEVEPSCVGIMLDGVEAKVDKDGQVLLKSPGLFSRYISEDPNQTANAFDPDGYFKTGDLGKVEGRFLHILGRASVDVIRFSGWKIMGPEIEDALSKISAIQTAFVVGVSDEKTGQRVAAVISLRPDRDQTESFDLASIRTQLSANGVHAYQLPTLLRLLRPNEEIPKTATGKPSKPRMVAELLDQESIAMGKVEVWDLSVKSAETKPFDWAGIQS